MPAFFVTATGTDLGKTYLGAALLRHWRALGRPVAALKPVMSGFDPADFSGNDAGQLLTAAGEIVSAAAIARLSPWRFRAPLSPDMAARREGTAIDFEALVAFCRQAIAPSAAGDEAADPNPAARAWTIVEGAGGVMAPIDDRHTMLDLMAALGLPVLLLTGSYLGAISHTLTALAALAQKRLRPAALIVNESSDPAVAFPELAETLSRHIPLTGLPILSLPRPADAAAIAAIAATLDRAYRF